MKTLIASLLILVSAASTPVSAANPLPPTLWKIFTLTPTGNDIILNWVTITEMNAVTYYVQHSKDALHWDCIDTIVTENVSFTGTEYRFTHKNPGSGDHYYRVITIDKVGFEESSPVRKITQENLAGSFRIIENPASGKAVRLDCALPIEIQVVDCSGKLLLRQKLTMGLNTIDLNQLNSGMYLLYGGGYCRKIILN